MRAKSTGMKLRQNFHAMFFLVSLVGGLILLGVGQLFPKALHSEIWSIFVYSVGLNYFVSGLSLWLNKKSPENFANIKLLGMLIRILSALGFIVLFSMLELENIILFIVNFFILFLFYLIFDIYFIISNLRQISKRLNPNE